MFASDDAYHRCRALRCALAINNSGVTLLERSFFADANTAFEDAMAILKALATEDTSSTTRNYQTIDSLAQEKLRDSHMRISKRMVRLPRERSQMHEQAGQQIANCSWSNDCDGITCFALTTISYDSQLGFSQFAAGHVLEEMLVQETVNSHHVKGKVVQLREFSSESFRIRRPTKVHLIHFHDCITPGCTSSRIQTHSSPMNTQHGYTSSSSPLDDLQDEHLFEMYVAIVLLNLVSSCVVRAQCKTSPLSTPDNARFAGNILLESSEKLLKLAIQVITNILPNFGAYHGTHAEREYYTMHQLQLHASISLLQFLVLRLASIMRSIGKSSGEAKSHSSTDRDDIKNDVLSPASQCWVPGTTTPHFNHHLAHAATNVFEMLVHDETTSLCAYYPTDTAPTA